MPSLQFSLQSIFGMVTHMYTYTLIDCDERLHSLVQAWKEAHIDTVAMDFEGEFNLHVYGEHLCLIQLNDGERFFLIDPFTVSMEAIGSFLEDAAIEKIMFDCSSDTALMRKRYGVQVENITDLRIHALALSLTGSLASLIERYLPDAPKLFAGSKKKNQRTNWMTRPLSEDQIQYALDDVAHLFALKKILEEEVREKGLAGEVAEKMKSAGQKTRGEERPPWSKVSSWKYLSTREKVYHKHFFLARDGLAQQYNVPAVRIMDKHLLLKMAKEVPQDAAAFTRHCPKQDRRLTEELVRALMKAKAEAEEELRGSSPR